MQKFLSLHLCLHTLHRLGQSSYKLGGTKGKMRLHQFPFDWGLYVFRAVEIKISPWENFNFTLQSPYSHKPEGLGRHEDAQSRVKGCGSVLNTCPAACQRPRFQSLAPHLSHQKIKVDSYIRVPAWVETGFAPGHWPILKGRKPLITPWRDSNPTWKESCS